MISAWSNCGVYFQNKGSMNHKVPAKTTVQTRKAIKLSLLPVCILIDILCILQTSAVSTKPVVEDLVSEDENSS